eukprot:UN01189
MKTYCLATHLNFRPPITTTSRVKNAFIRLPRRSNFLFSKLLSKKRTVIPNFAHK